MDLSLNLKALVSQRLMPRQEGKGRVAAVEIMLNSPLISDLIFKGEVARDQGDHEASRASSACRPSTRRCSTSTRAGTISYEDALRNADSVNDLRLKIKLHGKEAKDKDLTKGIEHLDIV